MVVEIERELVSAWFLKQAYRNPGLARFGKSAPLCPAAAGR